MVNFQLLHAIVTGFKKYESQTAQMVLWQIGIDGLKVAVVINADSDVEPAGDEFG